MVDIEQRLLEVLDLDAVLVAVVLFEGGVVVVGEFGLGIQLVEDLGHVEALRVLLVAVPAQDDRVLELGRLEDVAGALAVGDELRLGVAHRRDEVDEGQVQRQAVGLGPPQRDDQIGAVGVQRIEQHRVLLQRQHVLEDVTLEVGDALQLLGVERHGLVDAHHVDFDLAGAREDGEGTDLRHGLAGEQAEALRRRLRLVDLAAARVLLLGYRLGQHHGDGVQVAVARRVRQAARERVGHLFVIVLTPLGRARPRVALGHVLLLQVGVVVLLLLQAQVLLADGQEVVVQLLETVQLPARLQRHRPFGQHLRRHDGAAHRLAQLRVDGQQQRALERLRQRRLARSVAVHRLDLHHGRQPRERIAGQFGAVPARHQSTKQNQFQLDSTTSHTCNTKRRWCSVQLPVDDRDGVVERHGRAVGSAGAVGSLQAFEIVARVIGLGDEVVVAALAQQHLLGGVELGQVDQKVVQLVLVRHEDVVSLAGPRPRLRVHVGSVRLRQVVAHHQVAGRHVDALLEDAGGHQDVAVAAAEALHDVLLLALLRL